MYHFVPSEIVLQKSNWQISGLKILQIAVKNCISKDWVRTFLLPIFRSFLNGRTSLTLGLLKSGHGFPRLLDLHQHLPCQWCWIRMRWTREK